MMQVENEYGSYGEDKDYLRTIRDLVKKGVTCPLFSEDQRSMASNMTGTLIEEDKRRETPVPKQPITSVR